VVQGRLVVQGRWWYRVGGGTGGRLVVQGIGGGTG
jgi:hypothetical protein